MTLMKIPDSRDLQIAQLVAEKATLAVRLAGAEDLIAATYGCWRGEWPEYLRGKLRDYYGCDPVFAHRSHDGSMAVATDSAEPRVVSETDDHIDIAMTTGTECIGCAVNWRLENGWHYSSPPRDIIKCTAADSASEKP